ncbi:hypothetical protein JL722_6212 [Aureococcus anophagefferens]|nr:hypothetical protein JL722_6212 [Aureococcus anophagefferens]
MVASALQSSRPLYRVIGRSGAVVRADVELDSAQVGDLVYGAVVVAADASVAKTSAGVSRRRIVKPVGGYVSSRVLRPLSSDEVAQRARAGRPLTRKRRGRRQRSRDRAFRGGGAKQELLRQQSERGERGAATKDRGVITTKAPSKNAIADSIARKGGNSYYFAHGEQGRAEKTKVVMAPQRLDEADGLVVEDVTPEDHGRRARARFGASVCKHGENSYYYAHGATDQSVKVDTAPVKLETSARREVPITEGHKRQLDLPGRKGPFIRTRGRMDCKVKKCKLKKKPDKLVLLVYLDLHPETDSEDDAGWPCRSPWHLPPYLYGFLARAENATFTSLRDPLLRFVSELNHGWGSTAHFSGVEGEAFDFRHLGGRFADGTEGRAAQLRLVDDLVAFYLGRGGYRPWASAASSRPTATSCRSTTSATRAAAPSTASLDRSAQRTLALLGELVPGVEAGCADPPCVREPVAARHVKKFAAEDLSNATVARVRDYYALDYALLNALRVSRGLAPYDDGAAHDYGAWAGQNATVAAVFAAFRRTALALPANATADDVRATMAPPDRRLRTR